MTLEAYDPDRLDQLSLRVLDLCGRLRTLANKSRELELPPVDLHDRKALEWLAKLEDWLLRAETEVDHAARRAQGSRHARQFKAGKAAISAEQKD